MVAVEGSTLSFPEMFSGTASSWSHSNSSSRLGRNITPEAKSLRYNGSLTAQRALGVRVPGQVVQDQTVVRSPCSRAKSPRCARCAI